MAVKLREDDVVLRQLDDEVIILDLRSSEYLRVNASGAVVLQALHDTGDEAALVQALVAAFSIEPTDAERDVRSFLAELDKAGLLTERDSE